MNKCFEHGVVVGIFCGGFCSLLVGKGSCLGLFEVMFSCYRAISGSCFGILLVCWSFIGKL